MVGAMQTVPGGLYTSGSPETADAAAFAEFALARSRGTDWGVMATLLCSTPSSFFLTQWKPDLDSLRMRGEFVHLAASSPPPSSATLQIC